MKTFITLFMMMIVTGAIYAKVPEGLQGVWIPDIEKSIALMEKNMGEVDVAFMRDRYLPQIKRIITKSQHIAVSGKREYKADISFKEKQGRNFVMILSSKSTPDVTITFIPIRNGEYIMQSQNPADGSGNIVWRKQVR